MVVGVGAWSEPRNPDLGVQICSVGQMFGVTHLPLIAFLWPGKCAKVLK